MIEQPVFVFTSDKLGSGADELGEILIRGMFRTMTDLQPIPQVLIFLNSSVKLLTNEDIWENLELLEKTGTKILVCGTCVDYFNIRQQIKAELISNMKDIVTTISHAPKVVNF